MSGEPWKAGVGRRGSHHSTRRSKLQDMGMGRGVKGGGGDGKGGEGGDGKGGEGGGNGKGGEGRSGGWNKL